MTPEEAIVDLLWDCLHADWTVKLEMLPRDRVLATASRMDVGVKIAQGAGDGILEALLAVQRDIKLAASFKVK